MPPRVRIECACCGRLIETQLTKELANGEEFICEDCTDLQLEEPDDFLDDDDYFEEDDEDE